VAEHVVDVRWRHTAGDFCAGVYSREHTWHFDGGVVVPASPAVSSVKAPYSNPANVDPEEAFVAAIASCHMLSFLWEASRASLEAVSYEDHAVGRMTRNERGRLWVSRVELHPRIVWAGDRQPTPEAINRLHHKAHEECYIANSVKTEIVVGA
jgi:organic hydroperoxide reductase OsmC/OhrA